MSDPNDLGEHIPPRRIEEGDPVLFYDIDNSDVRERGRVVSIDHGSDLQLASIQIYSDERTEADVPFERPGRGYLYEADVPDGGEL